MMPPARAQCARTAKDARRATRSCVYVCERDDMRQEDARYRQRKDSVLRHERRYARHECAPMARLLRRDDAQRELCERGAMLCDATPLLLLDEAAARCLLMPTVLRPLITSRCLLMPFAAAQLPPPTISRALRHYCQYFFFCLLRYVCESAMSFFRRYSPCLFAMFFTCPCRDAAAETTSIFYAIIRRWRRC